MADYYPIISRAVAGLDKNTGEIRRVLYNRARAALVAQLRGVEPALNESIITRERLALEESIRKVEVETAKHSRPNYRPQLTTDDLPVEIARLIGGSPALEMTNPKKEKYHGIFMCHTGADKPFVRRLRNDLLRQGVPRVWVDEAEIEIGDSLMAKIEQGIKEARYIGVILSSKSIKAPWVKKELEVAMNREIAGGYVVVLPLLYEKCTLPLFLEGKLYADFTKPDIYEETFAKLLRRLRV